MTRTQRSIITALAAADVVTLFFLIGVLYFTLARPQPGSDVAFVPPPTQPASTPNTAVSPNPTVPPTIELATLVAATPTNAPAAAVTPTVAEMEAPQPEQPTATPLRAIPAGWSFYENSAEGFGLALPPSWKRINADAASFRSAVEALRKQNPEAVRKLEEQSGQVLATNWKFFAYDQGAFIANPSVLTSVSILAERLALAVPMDTYVETNVAQLVQLENLEPPITRRRLRLADGEAVEVRYHLVVKSQEGATIRLAIAQYILWREPAMFVVTFSTSAAKEQDYAPVFENIAATFTTLK